jgi:hypothetical protein
VRAVASAPNSRFPPTTPFYVVARCPVSPTRFAPRRRYTPPFILTDILFDLSPMSRADAFMPDTPLRFAAGYATRRQRRLMRPQTILYSRKARLMRGLRAQTSAAKRVEAFIQMPAVACWRIE